MRLSIEILVNMLSNEFTEGIFEAVFVEANILVAADFHLFEQLHKSSLDLSLAILLLIANLLCQINFSLNLIWLFLFDWDTWSQGRGFMPNKLLKFPFINYLHHGQVILNSLKRRRLSVSSLQWVLFRQTDSLIHWLRSFSLIDVHLVFVLISMMKNLRMSKSDLTRMSS